MAAAEIARTFDWSEWTWTGCDVDETVAGSAKTIANDFDWWNGSTSALDVSPIPCVTNFQGKSL